MWIDKKEYDVYGNLILHISTGKSVLDISEKKYEPYISTRPHFICKDKVIIYDGFIEQLQYDHNNNLIEHYLIQYLNNNPFESTKYPLKSKMSYKYKYDDFNKPIERKTYFIDKLDNKTLVEKLIYKYDEYNNLLEECSYQNYKEGISKVTASSEFYRIVTNKYNNTYDDKNRLIETKSDDASENEIVCCGTIKNKFVYSDNNVVIEYKYTNDTNLYLTIHHYYDDNNFNYKDVHYIYKNIISKIILYKMLNGRKAKQIVSPCEDKYKWEITYISKEESNVEIYEDIVTPDMLENIILYIISVIATYKLCVSVYALDAYTFEHEIGEIIDSYKNKLIVTLDYNQ